jgi:hypothetical protein
LTLTIWDESGFSFVPIVTILGLLLAKLPSCMKHQVGTTITGLGFILRTPKRPLMRFCFTIDKGAVTFDDVVFHLAALHHDCRKRVMVLWDHLPTCHAVKTHPDWFVFEYFPSYSPELNPVEPCGNHMKNVSLPNLLPTTDTENAPKSAMKINKQYLLPVFFK